MGTFVHARQDCQPQARGSSQGHCSLHSRYSRPASPACSHPNDTDSPQSTQFETSDRSDLSPRALAGFYRSVGGDYDQLFLQMPPQSIAFIYKTLSCPHSLQPASSTSYSDPSIPALKEKGFVIWQTIQLMLGPAEHVPFIQNALRVYDVRDPETGDSFPPTIPSSAFPPEPDPKMVAWHASVSNKLQVEAQQSATEAGRPLSADSSTTDEGTVVSTDERHNAAGFFANPLYKDKEGRPAIVTQLTKAPSKMFQGGKSMALNVYQGGKLIVSPNLFGGGKKSHSRSPSRDRDDRHRHSSHGGRHTSAGDGRRPSLTPQTASYDKSHRSSRRATTPTTSEEEEDAQERERRRRLRRHKSQDSRNSSQTRDSDANLRRHRSVDYKNHSRKSSQAEETAKASRSSPFAMKMAQQRQHRDGQSPQDYFNRRPSQQSLPVQPVQRVSFQRPPMPTRTSSEHGRSTNPRRTSRQHSHAEDRDRPDSDGAIARGTSRHGALGQWPEDQSVPTKYKHDLSPGAQEEWEGVRRTLSGQDGPKQDGPKQEFSRERRESVKPAVNGVSGRKYANEAPWS